MFKTRDIWEPSDFDGGVSLIELSFFKTKTGLPNKYEWLLKTYKVKEKLFKQWQIIIQWTILVKVWFATSKAELDF